MRLDAACVVRQPLRRPGHRTTCAASASRTSAALRTACDRAGDAADGRAARDRAGGAAATASTATPTASSRLVRQAAELGADVIKADPTDDLVRLPPRRHRGARARCSCAAAAASPTRRSSSARTPCSSRARAGIVYGRNVIQHPDPAAMVARAAWPSCTTAPDGASARDGCSERVRVGIVGGGLMGRELAAAIGRWSGAGGPPGRARARRRVRHEPRGAALVRPHRHRSPTRRPTAATCSTTPTLDVLYLAVPHHLHEELYLDAIAAGKDFLGEKPFGIDLAAGRADRRGDRRRPASSSAARARCRSSPAPSSPTRRSAAARSGEVIEVQHAFLHSSDLDRAKPINWKRQARYCGEIGVMGDLGMHVAHLPLRLGWRPADRLRRSSRTSSPSAPARDGEPVPCDTIDNATLHCDAGFPLTLRTHRIAPGHMNTWRITALGMDGGVSFSTAEPKTVHRFARPRRPPGLGAPRGRQPVGVRDRHRRRSSSSASPTRSCRCGPPTSPSARARSATASAAPRPHEALDAHRVFDAALRSGQTQPRRARLVSRRGHRRGERRTAGAGAGLRDARRPTTCSAWSRSRSRARFPGHHVIFREGDASDTCYVVRTGHARAIREHPDGRIDRARPLRPRRHLRRARDVRRRAALGHGRDARRGRRRSPSSAPTCAACCASTPTSRSSSSSRWAGACARPTSASPASPSRPSRAASRCVLDGLVRQAQSEGAGAERRARHDHAGRHRPARRLLARVGQPLPRGARARRRDHAGPRADHGPRPRRACATSTWPSTRVLGGRRRRARRRVRRHRPHAPRRRRLARCWRCPRATPRTGESPERRRAARGARGGRASRRGSSSSSATSATGTCATGGASPRS